MPIYYVNKNAQNNGDHEVHRDGCVWMPITGNKKPLGIFDNCKAAVKEAKKVILNQTDVLIVALNVTHHDMIIELKICFSQSSTN